MNGCDTFRAQLLAWFEAPGDPTLRAALRLDAHPSLCADCRRVLEEEEALQHWLELLDGTSAAPSGLAARILARLERQRDLEPVRAWLDLLPEPKIPEGLAARVLHGVRQHEHPSAQREPFVLQHAPAPEAAAAPATLRRRRPSWFVALPLAAAAAALAAFYVWRAEPSGVGQQVALELAEDAPSDELLAHLDWLEEWDLVVGEGDDLAPILGSLDEFETWLLELAAAAALDTGSGDAVPSPLGGTQRNGRG